MIFPACDNVSEPRATALQAAAASVSSANVWASVNGWTAALAYTTPAEEYEAASGAAALVDLGPLCRYTVRGKQSREFLARLTSCPVSELAVAESARGLVVSSEGFVVDFADLTRLSGDLYLLTTSMPLDRRLQIAARGFEVETANIASMIAALGIIGPLAREAAAAAGLDILEAEASAQGRVRGVELAVRPIRLGAAHGIEIVFPAEDALVVWERLRRKRPLPAAGLEAIEILRIEGGSPRPGVDFASADLAADLADARTPAEIGMTHLAPWNRGWFSGRRAMKAAGNIRTRLVGFSADCDLVPQGADVFSRGERAGRVTSSAFSPRFKRAVFFAELDAAIHAGSYSVSLPGGGRAAARRLETEESRVSAVVEEKLRQATEFGPSAV